MNITVILCTYNRCKSLAKALGSIAAQALPESVGWEVLVVDNNSSDGTREVVEEFSRRFPRRFRYLFEPQPGKSYALNSGCREAHGDILAFTDDDVTFEPSWLQNLTSALQGGEWAGSGGRTLPGQAFIPPRWLPTLEGLRTMGTLAVFDLGPVPGKLDRAPFGNNMAFRKEVLEKYGGFRTDLGPRPGSEIRHEDAEFGHRLLAAGEKLRYEPSAVVYHAIPEHRIQKGYFLKWSFDMGRASVREWGRGPSVLGIPRPYLNILNLGTVVMLQNVWRWITAVNPERRFYYRCWVWATAGRIKEYCHLLRTIPEKAKSHL